MSPYEVAFSSIVPDNPSIEEMKKIVVVDEQRPKLDPSWKNSEASLITFFFSFRRVMTSI